MARSRAQLRAIFWKLSKAGAVGAAVGAGIYGGKKYVEHRQRKKEEQYRLAKKMAKAYLRGDVVRNAPGYSSLLEDVKRMSPEAQWQLRRKLEAMDAFAKIQAKPKTVEDKVRAIKERMMAEHLFSAGENFGRDEATKIYDKRLKNIKNVEKILNILEGRELAKHAIATTPSLKDIPRSHLEKITNEILNADAIKAEILADKEARKREVRLAHKRGKLSENQMLDRLRDIDAEAIDPAQWFEDTTKSVPEHKIRRTERKIRRPKNKVRRVKYDPYDQAEFNEWNRGSFY